MTQTARVGGVVCFCFAESFINQSLLHQIKGGSLIMSAKIVIPCVLSFVCSSVTFSQIYKKTKKHGFKIWELLPLSQDVESLNWGIWKHVENCWQEQDKQKGGMASPSAVDSAPPTDQLLILLRVASCRNSWLLVGTLHVVTMEGTVYGIHCPCLKVYISFLL